MKITILILLAICSSAFAQLQLPAPFNKPLSLYTKTGILQALGNPADSSSRFLRIDGSWQTVSGGLTNWIDSLNSSAPNATVHVAALLAKNSATNVDAVVGPKGNGALIVAIPDGTNTNGNKRGQYAVDLQLSRSSQVNIASGNYSAIIGGSDNKASGAYSFDGAGSGNVASSNYCGIAAGQSCTTSAVNSFIGGGQNNAVSAAYSSIVCGIGNTLTPGSFSGGNEFLGGGSNNSMNSLDGVLVGGVGNSITSADKSFIGGGESNTINGNWSSVTGGKNNTADGAYCAIPGGEHLTLSNSGNFGFNGKSTNMTIANNYTSTFANTDLWLANNDSAARALYFYAPNNTTGSFPNGTKYVGFKAGAVSSSVIWTLPVSDGTSGQTISTDGSGVLSWASPGTSESGGGSLSGGIAKYFSPNGATGSNAQGLNSDFLNTIPQAETITNFYVNLDQAPGTVDSVVITLRKNGSDTPLSVVIAGAVLTSGSDIIDAVSFTAGDTYDISIVTSGTCASTAIGWGYVIAKN